MVDAQSYVSCYVPLVYSDKLGMYLQASEAEVGSRSRSVDPVAEAAETVQNHTKLQSPSWPTMDAILIRYGVTSRKVREAY